ncbi:MAG: AbrB family transcriptional regulator [Geminicoccaceae bacterium]|nr:AbrB family transcriptional regulator [Geminicoccaceae bacterium]
MSRAQLGRLALALAIGAAGGLLFERAGLPLAWLLGPMLATTIASLAGAPIAVPAALRGPTVAVLGVLLGSGFDEAVVERLLRWAPIVAALPLYLVVVVACALLYLRRIGGLEPRTAWFAATPGGLGEMIVFGDRAGGDMRTIALVHSTRILLVVFTIPFALRAQGFEIPSVPRAARLPAGPLDLVAMAACGVFGYLAGRFARLPAPALLGPMLASAAAHLSGLVHGAPPPLIVAAAQLVIGTQVGARFAGYPPLRVLQTVATGFALTMVMLGLVLASAWLLARASGLPLLVLVLALAPGGLAEMSLLALALGQDPALVAAVHILRIALLVTAAPLLFRWYEKRAASGEPPPAAPRSS